MPTNNALVIAAQAVLARWDCPKWEWGAGGSTAELMGGLRHAVTAEVENSKTSFKTVGAVKSETRPVLSLITEAVAAACAHPLGDEYLLERCSLQRMQGTPSELFQPRITQHTRRGK
jgi:hypothetical protein